ncbi:MAG: AAA family ATPase [Fibrobacter sp.]|nr:AAA family ATPase [Fibrobacter sp.]
MGNGLVKAITGVRRCGKSYLLNNIFFDYLVNHVTDRDHVIHMAFDSAEDLAKGP